MGSEGDRGDPLQIHVVTIFPEFFESPLSVSLLAKAIGAGLVAVELHDPRAHAEAHGQVDDYPFGGGAGMVMMPGPLFAAIEEIPDQGSVICLSPSGRPFDQAKAADLAAAGSFTLVCGRYEGVDQRVIDALCAEEISVGDYVLSGGEAAALAVIDAVVRLVPGVVGNAESLGDESFEAGLLEYPHFTRPAEFRGMGVPGVLRSGDHEAVAVWRRREALRRTAERRPDLLARAELSPEDAEWLASQGLWPAGPGAGDEHPPH